MLKWRGMQINLNDRPHNFLFYPLRASYAFLFCVIKFQFGTHPININLRWYYAYAGMVFEEMYVIVQWCG